MTLQNLLLTWFVVLILHLQLEERVELGGELVDVLLDLKFESFLFVVVVH